MTLLRWLFVISVLPRRDATAVKNERFTARVMLRPLRRVTSGNLK